MTEELSRHYRGRLIFGPFTAVDAGELAALEDEIGGPLPSGYRAFIEVANGGNLQYDVRVPPGEDGEVIGFNELCQVGRDRNGEYGPDTLLGAYRERPAPAKQLLPIARNGGGDTLFLDLSPENAGRLVAFVHGLPEWTGRTGDDVLATVGDTFDGYFDDLFIDDETAQVTWEDVRDDAPEDDWRRVVQQWLDEGLPDWRSRSWASLNE